MEGVYEPRFKNYFKSSVLQFNKVLQHYRLLKFVKKDRIVLIDGDSYQAVEGQGEIERIMGEQDWWNAIFGYKTYL